MTWALANWKLIGIGLLLAVLGLQRVHIAGMERDAVERRAVDAESQRLAERAQRTEEQRRNAAVAKEATSAQTQTAALDASLPAARAASDGVRDAATDAASRARASACPAVASARQPGEDPIGLLVDVLGRADKRAGELAEYADRLRIAGIACERSYDALTQ